MSKKRGDISGLHHVAVRRTAPDCVLGVIPELVNDAVLLCELKDRVLFNNTECSCVLKDDHILCGRKRKDRVSCVLEGRVLALIKNTEDIE